VNRPGVGIVLVDVPDPLNGRSPGVLNGRSPGVANGRSPGRLNGRSPDWVVEDVLRSTMSFADEGLLVPGVLPDVPPPEFPNGSVSLRIVPLVSPEIPPAMTPAVPELDEGPGLDELGFGVVVAVPALGAPALGAVVPDELSIPGVTVPFIGVVDPVAPGVVDEDPPGVVPAAPDGVLPAAPLGV